MIELQYYVPPMSVRQAFCNLKDKPHFYLNNCKNYMHMHHKIYSPIYLDDADSILLLVNNNTGISTSYDLSIPRHKLEQINHVQYPDYLFQREGVSW